MERMFIRLVEEGTYNLSEDSSNIERYDPAWLNTKYQVWLIPMEGDEGQNVFKQFKQYILKTLPRTFHFSGEAATFFFDQAYVNYASKMALITEEEDKVRWRGEWAYLPHSIVVCASYSEGLKITLSRLLDRNKAVIDLLLREAFPGCVFEWEKPYVPPPPLTFEERLKLEQERRLARIKQSLTPQDFQILELRSSGLSLWNIAVKLGLTMSAVRYSLQKLAMIPECAEKLGPYKPMPRNERFKKR